MKRFASLAFLVTAVGFCLPAGAKAPPSSVKPLDPAGLRREVASRKGKVVVVNLWATWCGPCKDEFPELVKAYNAERSKGVDLLTISFDDVKDVPSRVVPFLTAQKLATNTFINKSGFNFDEAYLKYLEPKMKEEDAFSIPRTYIFDRSGRLTATLVGGQSYATFHKALAAAEKK